MRKRRLYLIFIGLGVLVGVLVAGVFREREPEYGGKTLSEWLDTYLRHFGGAPGDPEPGNAIRQIGTNALPCVVKWILYKRPPWKAKLLGRWNNTLQLINPRWKLTDNEQLRRDYFIPIVLLTLGPKAKGALPALMRVATDPELGAWAMGLLTSIGVEVEAVPALVASLTNQDNRLRLCAVTVLGDLGINARSALPALQELLKDPDPYIKEAVTNALWKINGSAVEEAVKKAE